MHTAKLKASRFPLQVMKRVERIGGITLLSGFFFLMTAYLEIERIRTRNYTDEGLIAGFTLWVLITVFIVIFACNDLIRKRIAEKQAKKLALRAN